MNNLMVRKNYIPRCCNDNQNQVFLNGECKTKENVVQGKVNHINRNNFYTKNYSRYTHYYVVDYKDVYGRLLCRRVYRRSPMVIYRGNRYLGSNLGRGKLNYNCI